MYRCWLPRTNRRGRNAALAILALPALLVVLARWPGRDAAGRPTPGEAAKPPIHSLAVPAGPDAHGRVDGSRLVRLQPARAQQPGGFRGWPASRRATPFRPTGWNAIVPRLARLEEQCDEAIATARLSAVGPGYDAPDAYSAVITWATAIKRERKLLNAFRKRRPAAAPAAARHAAEFLDAHEKSAAWLRRYLESSNPTHLALAAREQNRARQAAAAAGVSPGRSKAIGARRPGRPAAGGR